MARGARTPNFVTVKGQKINTTQLNKEYLIRVHLVGEKKDRLITSKRFIQMILVGNLAGAENTVINKLKKVQNSMEQQTVIKLRRGIKFTFVAR